MEYEIHNNMTQDEALIVRRGLSDFASQYTEPRKYQEFGIVVRNTNGKACGGISGNTIWNWLRIDVLWLPEELRGKGYGRDLLMQTEELARNRGCNFAMLSTFEFEARGFYEHHGYMVDSKTENFPDGHTHYHLKKTL